MFKVPHNICMKNIQYIFNFWKKLNKIYIISDKVLLSLQSKSNPLAQIWASKFVTYFFIIFDHNQNIQ